MKASYFEKHGGPEVLQYGELPDPTPESNEILIDIHAASVNGADWKVRTNQYGRPIDFPYILGRDFSGIVSALGSEAADFKVGDEVFGVCENGQEGTYAEKIAMDQKLVALKPSNLSHLDAASLALIGLTAIVSIEDCLQLQKDEKILIQGGAGGVAGFAIQLAKHIGAYVITTTSATNSDYVKALGADEVIDYKTQDFTEMVSDCDAVFDTVGGDVAMRSFEVIKSGGRAAFIASGFKAPDSPRDDVQSLRPDAQRSRARMERVAELASNGVVKIPERQIFSLSQAQEAHRISEGRHLRGKLLFEIKE